MHGGERSRRDAGGLAPGEAYAQVAFDADRRPWQRSLRWESHRPGRRPLFVMGLAAIAATLLELAGFDVLMRERVDRERKAIATMPIIVRIEDPFPEPPPEPQPSRRTPASPAAGASASMRARRGDESPRRWRAAEASVPRAPTEAPPLLVDSDGRALLPDDHAHVLPKDGATLFRHDSPVPYSQTRFEQAFAPRDEDLGHELIRRSTIKHTWRTPWGGQITCVASMTIVLLGGCGWGLAPRATAEELRLMRADPPPSKPDKSALRRLGS